MTAEQPNQYLNIEIVANIMRQIIQSQIIKYKKATGGVKGALRRGGEQRGPDIWINTL
jgi:hypothetical protein